ncbi:MAG: U32 family peptidase [Clostridiales bacterium]|nr:U32 family peptidase [Candidatus Crickella caballi]
MINRASIKLPELLSPVGGWSHLSAAINNGADAVYMGGSAFNARIYAENFTKEDLPKAIDYAHAHNVKVYITQNTLIKDSELYRAFEHAAWLYEIGADAIIVQDMGLARLIHKYLPDFPMHLSTQGTVYNTHALSLVKELGFTRVVPARELGIDEIRELCTWDDGTGNRLEFEVFIHGALCMCYSGQCQLSRGLSTKGDSRSGNRGTCAQPCRHPYTDDKGVQSYALSPKDICYIEHLPELIEAGVDSFKIEGRIKSPEYVAVVTRIYRKYMDLYCELLAANDGNHEVARNAYTVKKSDIQYLRQAFNRGGFSTGYLLGNPGDELLSGTSPKNQGIRIGRVVAIIDTEAKAGDMDERRAVRGALKRGKVLACISLSRGSVLNMGDGIEFRSDDPDFSSDPIGNVTTYVKGIGEGHYIVGDFDEGFEIGDIVYKVTDKQLLETAMSTPEKKLPATFSLTARIGQYLSLVMTDVKSGYSTELIADHVIEKAYKAATDEDRIIGQLCRLGGTVYTADVNSCDVQLDEEAMVPVSLINRMRRECSDRLIEERTGRIKSDRKPLSRAELDVIASGEMLGREYDGELAPLDKIVPIEEFTGTGTPYILNVSKGKLDRYIEENFSSIVETVRESGILIGNLGWIKQFRDAGIKVYADYGLNTFNAQAAKLFNELGLVLHMYSHETGIADSRGLPLMISEHPVDSEYLVDRKGVRHNIKCSPFEDKYLIF